MVEKPKLILLSILNKGGDTQNGLSITEKRLLNATIA